jgi:hypothetical protein
VVLLLRSAALEAQASLSVLVYQQVKMFLILRDVLGLFSRYWWQPW